MLGFEVNASGIVAAGYPIGEPDFVAEQVDKSAEKVVSLVQALTNLDLPAQNKLLLARKSMQVKVSHFAHCAELENIQAALLKSEKADMASILQIVGREECMLDIKQLRLPLRKGGLGIQCLTESNGLVCKSGYIAAAALTQQALENRSEGLQPFNGVSGEVLQQVWQQISAACTCKTACTCEQLEAVSLTEALAEGTLPGLQHVMSQRLADRSHVQLLGKYEAMALCAVTKVAEQQLARLLSVQHTVATEWLNILPTKDLWAIDDDTMKSALRFMLQQP